MGESNKIKGGSVNQPENLITSVRRQREKKKIYRSRYVREIVDCKAPGHDTIHGLWFNGFTRQIFNQE